MPPASFRPWGYFIEQRLGLAPGDEHIDQRGDEPYEKPMQHEMRLDSAIDPKRKQEWHQQGSDENGSKEGRLSKEMKNGKDDCKYRQFCAHAAYYHPHPMQAAQDAPVDGEFV